MLLIPLLCLAVPVAPWLDQGNVTLQEGTATFSQNNFSGYFPPDEVYDGVLLTGNGWAIFDTASSSTSAEIAVWEVASDVNGSQIEFRMRFLHDSSHRLGRFRFSVTDDPRNTFADGLDVGGAVAANWTVLSSPSASRSLRDCSRASSRMTAS